MRIALPGSAPLGPKVKALTLEELRSLIEQVPEKGGRRLMVRLLSQTGMRLGEVLALRWEAVDLEAGVVKVRERLLDGGFDVPKSLHGVRDIPIAHEMCTALKAHKLAAYYSRDRDLVFPTLTGRPQSARNLYRWFKPAAERAAVGWAGFHALRHTAASRWLHAGVDIAKVSRLLGHADAGFTLRTYISVMPKDLPSGDTLAAAVVG